METNKKTQILEEILQKTREQKEKIESTKITNWGLLFLIMFVLVLICILSLRNQGGEEGILVLITLISYLLVNGWYKKHLLSKKGEIMECLNLTKKQIKFGTPVAPKKKKQAKANYEDLQHQIAWNRYLNDEQYLTYLILSLIGWRSKMPNKFLSEIETLSEKEREEYYKQIDELYEYFSKL